jgi:hypothetical protein
VDDTTVIAFEETGDNPDSYGMFLDNVSLIWDPSTAIELASLTADAGVGAVTLDWETGTEVDNAGFNIYRATAENGPYTKVNDALIAAEGDPVSGTSYSFLDEGVPAGVHYYLLEDVDYSGVRTRHGPVSATVVPRFRCPGFRPVAPGR